MSLGFKILFELLCLVVGSFGTLVLIKRTKAKWAVLREWETLAPRFENALLSVCHPDVREETRKSFEDLAREFRTINRLRAGRWVDWVALRESQELLAYPLFLLDSQIRADISLAERARKEGARLLEEVPKLIEKAEQKVAGAPRGHVASRHLSKARVQFYNARDQSLMPNIDWVLVYTMLSSARLNLSYMEESLGSVEPNASTGSSAPTLTSEFWASGVLKEVPHTRRSDAVEEDN